VVSTKGYVAGRTSNIEGVRAVQRVLREHGIEITLDWTSLDGNFRPDWDQAPLEAERIAEMERHACVTADFLVLVCGSDTANGLGMFIETGMALAYGIPVIVVGSIRDSIFWYLRDVTRIDTVDELPDTLRAWFPSLEAA